MVRNEERDHEAKAYVIKFLLMWLCRDPESLWSVTLSLPHLISYKLI